MLKVIVIGHGDMLAHLIAGALDAEVEIVGVMRYDVVNTNPVKRFFKDLFNPSKEYSYIKSYNLHEIVAKGANSKKFHREIIETDADLVICGTWGEKLTKDTINLPKMATINVHPSLLPKYRGANPYLQTIWHKETKSGVTFHLMDENFDTGAILLQKEVEILPNDTSKELKERTVLKARLAVCELLNTLKSQVILPVPQIENKASYFPRISQDDVMLDFTRSAEDVSAHIRAFHPWCKTYFSYRHKFLIPDPYSLEILDSAQQSEKVNFDDKSFIVKCGDGKYLKMKNLRFY